MDAPFPPQMLADIERFFKTVHPKLPKGRNVYGEVFETDLFFPLQRKTELWEMVQTAASISPRTVMEIGADKGGGLYHWGQSLPTVQRVIANEIRGLPYKDQFEYHFPDLDFCWVHGSSYTRHSKLQVESFLGADRIDVLFIDGDKGAMLWDFDAYLPLMSDRGLVFLHDVTDPAPGRAFDEIKGRGYSTRFIHDVSDFTRADENERNGKPPANPYEGWLRHWKGVSCGVGVVYLDSLARAE